MYGIKSRNDIKENMKSKRIFLCNYYQNIIRKPNVDFSNVNKTLIFAEKSPDGT